jgi:hypothetical protein
MSTPPIQGGKSRPIKEAFFVRSPTPDAPLGLFFNSSAYIGKPMPHTVIKTTVAMSVVDGVAAYSVLQPTKAAAKTIAAADVVMPKAGLTRLQRRAKEIDKGEKDLSLGANELLLEMDNTFYRLNYNTDDSGLLTLETAPDQEDATFDLPMRGVQVSIYMRSPIRPIILAVSYMGHLGKPLTPETVTRAAAQVLNAISGLFEFRVLSKFEAAKVPAAPRSFAFRPAVRKNEDRVVFELGVNMFDAAREPVKSGTVVVEIDLEHANPTAGHLLYNFTPSEEVAEEFPAYREIVGAAITSVLAKQLRDELSSIAIDIVLGDVDGGTLDRLRSAVGVLEGVDVTPLEYQTREVVVAEELPVAP